MKLNFTSYGDGPPLLILHGLFGSGRNWTSIAKVLGASWRVLAVDLRNHGDSPWNARMDYVAMAGDLLSLIESERLSAPTVLGHSMGGKVAMTAALEAPEAVATLIVADIAPVTYGHSHMAYIEAMCALDLSAVQRRSEADAAMAATVADASLRAFFLHNLSFGGEEPRWQINLEAIAAAMPGLMQWDITPETARYDGPALFIGGGRSKFIVPDYHPVIRTLFPRAEFATVAGAGHWLHAEKPAEFLAVVRDFLDRLR